MFPKYSISWFFSSYRYWTTLYKYCTFNNYMALGFNQSHTRLLSMGYVLKCLLKAHVLKTGCSWQTSVKWPTSCWGLRSINRSTLDWVITEWSCWEVGKRKQSLRQEVVSKGLTGWLLSLALPSRPPHTASRSSVPPQATAQELASHGRHTEPKQTFLPKLLSQLFCQGKRSA